MASGFQSLRLFRLRKKERTHNPLYGVPNLINSYCLDVGLLPFVNMYKSQNPYGVQSTPYDMYS